MLDNEVGCIAFVDDCGHLVGCEPSPYRELKRGPVQVREYGGIIAANIEKWVTSHCTATTIKSLFEDAGGANDCGYCPFRDADIAWPFKIHDRWYGFLVQVDKCRGRAG